MIDLIQEIRNICRKNIYVSWLHNNANEEFARIVELIDEDDASLFINTNREEKEGKFRKGLMNLITVPETDKLRRGFVVEVVKTKCKCENKQIHNLIKDEDIGLDLFQAMTEDYNYYVDEILGRCRDCDTELEIDLHYTVTHEE